MGNSGERLREERLRLGKTQVEFAEIGGVHRNSQANYENDIKSPDSNYLASLSNVGVDILYVVTGIRTPPPVITTEEQKLVENYRAMDDSAKLNIQAVGDSFAKSKSNLKTG